MAKPNDAEPCAPVAAHQPPPALIPLAYESVNDDGPKSRPAWVYAVMGLYALILAGLALGPGMVALAGDDDQTLRAALTIPPMLIVVEAALIFLPVRISRRRTVARTRLWIPLLVSGLLAGLLVMAGGLAVGELLRLETGLWVVVAAAALVWLGWALAFWLIAGATSAAHVGNTLHRYLIAGSVLELLVAVPTHLVVRRRDECCAGIFTATAIIVGVVILFLAFGPSVVLLYYRRARQIAPPNSPPRA
jgi:hypothetical protein